MISANESIVTSWCMWLYCDDHNVNAAQCCENRVIIISSQILSNNDADDNLSDQQLSIFAAATAFKVIFNNMCPNNNISPSPLLVYRKIKAKWRFFNQPRGLQSELCLSSRVNVSCEQSQVMFSDSFDVFKLQNRICHTKYLWQSELGWAGGILMVTFTFTSEAETLVTAAVRNSI